MVFTIGWLTFSSAVGCEGLNEKGKMILETPKRSEPPDNIRNRENQKSRYNRKPPKPKPTQHAMQTHTAYERFDLGVRGAKESGRMHYDLLEISCEISSNFNELFSKLKQ
jgi:hypothetical protein